MALYASPRELVFFLWCGSIWPGSMLCVPNVYFWLPLHPIGHQSWSNLLPKDSRSGGPGKAEVSHCQFCGKKKLEANNPARPLEAESPFLDHLRTPAATHTSIVDVVVVVEELGCGLDGETGRYCLSEPVGPQKISCSTWERTAYASFIPPLIRGFAVRFPKPPPLQHQLARTAGQCGRTDIAGECQKSNTCKGGGGGGGREYWKGVGTSMSPNSSKVSVKPFERKSFYPQ